MRVEANGHGVIVDETLTRVEQADEYLLMGLRLAEGIDPARYAAFSGRPLDPARIAVLARRRRFVSRRPTAACASRGRDSRCSMRWWRIWRLRVMGLFECGGLLSRDRDNSSTRYYM